MTTSEVDKTPEGRTVRVNAIHALAVDGMTPSLLAAQVELLALVDEALLSTRPLRDLQRAEILLSMFENVAAAARKTVLSIKDPNCPSLTEREATSIAAAGELLGFTDEELFSRKLDSGRALYDRDVSGRTPWFVRQVRATIWTRISSIRSVDRNAKACWWPAFLVAVERRLASTAVVPAQQAPHADNRPQPSARITAEEDAHLGHLARSIQLSGAVRKALDAACTSCEARNRAFYTPDLLLALLDMPRSRAADCLEETQTGWARDVREWLSGRISWMNTNAAYPFDPFEWPERPEVQIAQDLAVLDCVPFVTEIYLLLGVLGAESNTRQELVELLGPESYDRLCKVANDRRRRPPDALRTPGPG